MDKMADMKIQGDARLDKIIDDRYEDFEKLEKKIEELGQ